MEMFKPEYGEKMIRLVKDIASFTMGLGLFSAAIVMMAMGTRHSTLGSTEIEWVGIGIGFALLIVSAIVYGALNILAVIANNSLEIRKKMNEK